MGKKILGLMALLTCCVMIMASCAASINMDNSGYYGSNGGFAVETNDYVYFINGIESYSTTYKTGKVTKGSLMRTKKTNLTKLSDISADEYETVVSKLIVSSDYNAGFYIYGDYVYYAAPSTEKDRTGTVKSSKILFFRTKLDGTETSKKISETDFTYTAQFRFYQKDGAVYLSVYDTKLYIFNADTRKDLYDCDNTITELIFDKANASDHIYYTMKPINTNLYDPDDSSAKTEDYHELHRVTIGADVKDEIVLSGSGSYTVNTLGGNTDSDVSKIGFTGATFDLIHLENGVLYFSFTILDSTVSSTTYIGLDETDISTNSKTTLDKVNEKSNCINNGDSNAATIFSDTSLYLAKDCIVYIDSTFGLVKYDYNNYDKSETSFGRTRLFYSAKCITSAISFVKGDYVYYDVSNVFYRVNLTNLLNGSKTEEELQINSLAISTSWYTPEVVTVSGSEYFLGSYTGSNYYSYVYAIDMTQLIKDVAAAKLTDDDDEDDDDIYDTTEDYEKVSAVAKTLLGVMTETDADSLSDALDTLEDSES